MNDNARPASGKAKKSIQLLAKEEEFKRLNAELEAKTSNLISEAESILKGHDTLFSDVTVEDEDFKSAPATSATYSSTKASGASFASLPKQKKPDNPDHGSDTQDVMHTSSGNALQRQSSTIKKTDAGKPPPANHKRPGSGKGIKATKKPNSHARQLSSAGKSNDADPTQLLQERITLATKISDLEDQAADETYSPSKMNDHVLPDVANEIGSEATIRFLKAKLRVMQEELDRIANECRDKEDTIQKLEKDVKDRIAEELNLQKLNEGLQNQIEKQKKLHEELRQRNSDLEQDAAAFRKEVESMKKDKKQTSSDRNAIEVRLNRALEEVEKYKAALLKTKETSKDSNDSDRKRIEQLTSENKKLDKQKQELLSAFKKQMKMIDNLKRQKIHIEAAKLLEFTEEEFIRALNLGSAG